METFDFNKIQKSTFPVILKDKKKTKLTLLNQTKEIASAIVTLNEPKNTGEEAFACWHQTVALILSRNQEGVTVEASEVEELYDLEEMMIFVRKYDEFCAEILLGKN